MRHAVSLPLGEGGNRPSSSLSRTPKTRVRSFRGTPTSTVRAKTMLLPFGTPHPSIARDPDATSGIALRVRLRVAVTLSEAKRNRMGLATLRSG